MVQGELVGGVRKTARWKVWWEMYQKILKAAKLDQVQAEEGELLVPNPLAMPTEDSDFFVGVRSRRPCRYGVVVAVEGITAEQMAEADNRGIIGARGDEPVEPERLEDIVFFLGAIADFDIGALAGCSYTFEDDEVSW